MMKGTRHTGIVVENLEVVKRFYLGLGFSVQSEDVENGAFIEQVTGLDKVTLKWVKMSLVDGSLLELLQYQQPTLEKKTTNQLSNEMGVSHVAFTVENIDKICEQVIVLGGGLVNEPALSKNRMFRVAYCHDVEGNLFEVVEVQYNGN